MLDHDDSTHIDLGLELRSRFHGTWSDDDLATFHLFTLDAAEKGAHIVAGLALMCIEHKPMRDLILHVLGPIPCGTSLVMVS
jgi:hypothetical protein